MKFSDARAKIERADEHIGKLEEWLANLPNSHISRVDTDPQFSYQTLVHDIMDREKIFTTAALWIGDAVHNLKCALDYAWMQTIERVATSAVSKFAKFPVYPTNEALEDALRGAKIDVSCEPLFRLILDEIRPHNGRDGNFAIWAVYVLDKRDKHRLLIPLASYGSIANIELQDKAGTVHRGDTWGTSQPLPYYVTFTADLSIKNKGKLAFDIQIDEAMLAYTPRVKDTFSICSRLVLEVVETLEAFTETI
jgi:hypothetical protein